ncbi:MAG: hypothetical protein IJQ73_07815 [Kiritimatiellae bacterium]|nr:hypothetical protein [Kiritimatiellia bacterium]
MTDDELVNEILELEAEMKTWGKPPRNLADRTPWQVAVVKRSDHLINWVLGNRPEPPPFEEWRKTLPPRTVYREEGK